jgi:hypothetical protein
MMPYDSYRLYQAERLKSRAEIQLADEQIGRLAAAASELFCRVARPAATAIRGLASWRNGSLSPAACAGCECRMLEPTDASPGTC